MSFARINPRKRPQPLFSDAFQNSFAMMVIVLLSQMLVLPVSAASTTSGGGSDGPAQLPATYFQTALANTPAPGGTILVSAGGSLQTALNNAKCGDTIKLAAGATFAGVFTLLAKACDALHWIIVRTSTPDSSLPAEGKRMS